MKNKEHYGKKITKKFIKKIIIWVSLYTFIFVLTWFICRYLSYDKVWYSDDFLYQILTKIGYNPYILISIWLFGFLFIIVICLYKTLSYIDQVVDKSTLLVSNNEDDIKLPQELEDVEKRMNQIKKQAIQNLKLAQENEQRKNDLIVYLAHDIKTPLTSMIGYLSLLDEATNMPVKQRKKYTSIALDKSYRLEDLINELFDVARFNSEKIILQKEQLDLNLMIEQIIDDFYPVLKEVNKKILFNYDERITLFGDPDKLGRVFNNLVKNAINYSNENSNIIIDIKKIDNKVLVNVINEGNQLPKEKLKKIFEKFYRLDSSRTSKTGGSGLGLAIAKDIITLHNGNITCESNDKKTTFHIELPLDIN